MTADERIPMVNVTARIVDQNGRPVQRAKITLRLTTVERYCGLVVPRETSQYTDASGCAILRVWPNELGSEGSEYMCTIMYGDATSAASGCGCAQTSGGLTQSQRFRVVVPNSDCNLFDITDLPPYEQRGSGQVITAEVAAFASQAANAADMARGAISSVESLRNEAESFGLLAKASAEDAKLAVQTCDRTGQRAQAALDNIDAIVLNFETSVVDRTEKTAGRLVTQAQACIRQAEDQALQSLEQRLSDELSEISELGHRLKVDGREAVHAAGEAAVILVEDKGGAILEEMREECRLFGEDFEALTERAESAAKRAGCSAASAANSATKACACADRAENAAQGVERHADNAKLYATQAETAKACAEEAASRAERVGDNVSRYSELCAGSVKIAQEAARSAECANGLAKENADLALEAARSVKESKDTCVNAAKEAKCDAEIAATCGNQAESYLRRTQEACACADALAKEAEQAASRASGSADLSSENARICKELEDACTWAAEKAITKADEAKASADQTAADREVVEACAASVANAVQDKALELLTPQVVAEAIEQATTEAQEAASEAKATLELCKEQIDLCGAEVEKAQAEAEKAEATRARIEESAREAARQANLANIRADRAEKAASEAEETANGIRADCKETLAKADEACERAEAEALKLVDAGRDPARIAGMFGQLMAMSDRLFKLELAQIGAY